MGETMDQPKLKSCPFCGGDVKFKRTVINTEIRCGNDKCGLIFRIDGEPESNVIAAWNGRAPTSFTFPEEPVCNQAVWILARDRQPTHIYSVVLWATGGRLHFGEDYLDVGRSP